MPASTKTTCDRCGRWMYTGINGLAMSRTKEGTRNNQFWVKPYLCGPCRKVVIRAVRDCFKNVSGDNFVERCVDSQLEEADNETFPKDANNAPR